MLMPFAWEMRARGSMIFIFPNLKNFKKNITSNSLLLVIRKIKSGALVNFFALNAKAKLINIPLI